MKSQLVAQRGKYKAAKAQNVALREVVAVTRKGISTAGTHSFTLQSISHAQQQFCEVKLQRETASRRLTKAKSEHVSVNLLPTCCYIRSCIRIDG